MRRENGFSFGGNSSCHEMIPGYSQSSADNVDHYSFANVAASRCRTQLYNLNPKQKNPAYGICDTTAN